MLHLRGDLFLLLCPRDVAYPPEHAADIRPRPQLGQRFFVRDPDAPIEYVQGFFLLSRHVRKRGSPVEKKGCVLIYVLYTEMGFELDEPA